MVFFKNRWILKYGSPLCKEVQKAQKRVRCGVLLPTYSQESSGSGKVYSKGNGFE